MAFASKFKTFIKILAAIAIVSTSVAGFFAIKKSNTKIFNTNELKKVAFNTNGRITSAWLAEDLRIKKDVDLFALDIFSMKRRLEEVSQVKKVLIEKRYPDTLFIKIDERMPILKILVDIKGEKKVFFVDGNDGKIFEPICYSKSDMDEILCADMILCSSGGKKFPFLPIKGINKISEFIDIMENEFRDIFNSIKFIDLKNYDNRTGAVWSKISIKLKNGITVVFGTKDFHMQLLRLEFLLNEKCANNLSRIKKIDLSSKKDVIVEYK